MLNSWIIKHYSINYINFMCERITDTLKAMSCSSRDHFDHVFLTILCVKL